jgi:hypothetical protein
VDAGWRAGRALARLSEVALDHLESLDPQADGVPAELVDRLRDRYRSRLAHDLDVEEARLDREQPG